MQVVEEFMPQGQVILPRDMAPEDHGKPQLCNGAGA